MHPKKNEAARTAKFVLSSIFMLIGVIYAQCEYSEFKKTNPITNPIVESSNQKIGVPVKGFTCYPDRPLEITPTTGKNYSLDSDDLLIVQINDEEPFLYNPKDPSTHRHAGKKLVTYKIWSATDKPAKVYYKEE